MKDLMVLLADGFEDLEALSPVDLFRRKNLTADLVSIKDELVRSAHDIYIKSDFLLSDVNPDDYRAIYLPGGLPGADNLMEDDRVIEILKKFDAQNKFIFAICAAPKVLNRANILKDGEFTCYPGVEKSIDKNLRRDEPVHIYKNIVTSMGPGTSLLISLKAVEILGSSNLSDELKKELLFDKLGDFFKKEISQ